LDFQDVVGVTLGGILGHALCTGLAVVGGRLIAQKISVRTGKLLKNICITINFAFSVTIIGGIVFLLFAVTSLFFDPTAE